MKYSEFEKLMKNKGFDVKDDIDDVVVIDSNEWIVSKISKEEPYSFRTHYTAFMHLEDDLQRYIAQVSMELAFTELKDREEELEYMKRFNEEQIELHKQNTEYKDEEQAVGNYFKKERDNQ